MGEGTGPRAATISRFQLIWEGGAGKIPVGVAGGHPGLVSHPWAAFGTPYKLEGRAGEEPRTHSYLSICLGWGLGSHFTDRKVIRPSQAASKSSRPSSWKDLSGGLEGFLEETWGGGAGRQRHG